GATDLSAQPPTRAQQRADALALMAETALHHELDPGTPGERYQVVVHVDAPVARRSGSAGPVGARRRWTRFRGNVPAVGVRRQPDGDAIRCRRARCGDRRSDPDYSPGVTACVALSRPRVSLSRLWVAARRRPSRTPLGGRRTHDTLKPRV